MRGIDTKQLNTALIYGGTFQDSKLEGLYFNVPIHKKMSPSRLFILNVMTVGQRAPVHSEFRVIYRAALQEQRRKHVCR